MIGKAFLLITILSTVRCQLGEYDPNPSYRYSYTVDDPFTGNYQSKTEARDGDIVRGQYSVDDPDGKRRTVEYIAGPGIGFRILRLSRTPIVKTPVQVVPHTLVITPRPYVVEKPQEINFDSVAATPTPVPIQTAVRTAGSFPRFVPQVSAGGYQIANYPFSYAYPQNAYK